MPRPAPYQPDTNFSDYSASNPTRPMRGQDLDVEFNAIQVSLTETQTALAGVVDDAGGLRLGIVTKYHLTDDFAVSLAGDIYTLVEPTVAAAQGAAGQAQVHANNAQAARLAAEAAAASAVGEGSTATTARQQAQSILGQVVQSQNEAAGSAIAASNWSNAALGHANQGALYRNEAREWAEFIGGPVEEAALDPDAYDDGYWSAKWWALQAARWVQTGGGAGGGDGLPALPGPEGFGTVVYSLAELDGLLGPLDNDIVLVTTPASIWRFIAGDVTAADGTDVRAPGDSSDGRWHRLPFAAESGVEFYEGPTEPVGAAPGAIWIDTSGDPV